MYFLKWGQSSLKYKLLRVCLLLFYCLIYKQEKAFALSTESPPDIIASQAGQLRLRAEHGSTDATNQIFIVKNGIASEIGFLDNNSSETTIKTDLWVSPGDKIDILLYSSLLSSTQNPVAYGKDRTIREEEPKPRVLSYFTEDGEYFCGSTEGPGMMPVSVNDLFNNSFELLSLTCWEDHNNLSIALDYVPGSLNITPTEGPSPVKTSFIYTSAPIDNAISPSSTPPETLPATWTPLPTNPPHEKEYTVIPTFVQPLANFPIYTPPTLPPNNSPTPLPNKMPQTGPPNHFLLIILIPLTLPSLILFIRKFIAGQINQRHSE